MTEPVVHCRHLLLCRSVWYDGSKPDLGIGLAGIHTRLSAGGGGFPFRLDRMFVYAQLWGDDGEYYPYIRLVKIVTVGYDEEEEIQLGVDGGVRTFPMPTKRPVTITGLQSIQELAFPIFLVPFVESGLYEFQLWIDEIDYPVGREQIHIGG